MSSSDHQQLLIRSAWRHRAKSFIAKAMKDMNEPGAADVEVGDTNEEGSWDEPATDWMNTTKDACDVSVKQESLPTIGATLKGIEVGGGKAHLIFDDGTSLAFSFDEAPSDHLHLGGHEIQSSPQQLDLIAAVRNGEMLGAMDSARRGAHDIRFWGVKVEAPFDLYLLHNVPLKEAISLNDVGARHTRFRSGKHAWAVAQKYAETAPFKRVR